MNLSKIRKLSSFHLLVCLILFSLTGGDASAGKRKRECAFSEGIPSLLFLDYCKENPSIPKVPKGFKILDQEEGQLLFEKMRDNDTIPFAHFVDGCYARAHRVAYELKEEGIESLKVWVSADEVGAIQSDKYKGALWSYHVASIIPVINEDNQVVWNVIDPTLLDSLASVGTWLAQMKLPKAWTIKYSSRQEYFRSDLAFGVIGDVEDMEDALNMSEAVCQEHKLSLELDTALELFTHNSSL